MTKTVYRRAEFDTVAADPQGVASVQIAGTQLGLFVEDTFPFVLEYAGGSALGVKPAAGEVSVQATRASKVLYDNLLEEIA